MTRRRSRRGRRGGGRLAAILLGLAISVAMLVAAEVALRLAWPDLRAAGLTPAFPEVFDHLDNVHHEPDSELLWRLRPGYDEGGVQIGALGFRGAVSEPEPGGWRVAALGDSITFGFSNPRYEDTWPAQLEVLVSGACETDVPVLDAGVTGYSSEQGRRLYPLRIRPLRPEVSILLYGYNDHHLSGASDEEKLEGGAGRAALHLLRGLSISRALRKLAFEELALAPDLDLEPRVSLERFRENLRALVAEIRDGGGAAVLVTVPLRPGIPLVENPVRLPRASGGKGWVSPIRWLARRLGPGAEDALMALVFGGVTPDPEWLRQVEPALDRAVADAPDQPLPRFALGLARHARGDLAGARADFAAARDLDSERRDVDAYNQAIRELAVEEGVALVDLEAALVAAERRGGPTSFYDVVHLTARGNGIAAAALAPVVAEALGCAAPADAPSPPSPGPRI